MFLRTLKNIALPVIFFALLFMTTSTSAHESLALQIHPYLPATELVDRFTPLANYLSKKIGKPVVIRISKDYQEHIDLIGNNKADIAYMGPASYVKMVRIYGKKPMLARQDINGKPTFMGAIIIPKDSPLNSLKGLKGKRFAFGDPNSTMGHLVPRYMIWEAGVDVKDFAGYSFIDNHHNVVLGVLADRFDAGAVKDDVFYEYEKRGLKVLTWTPPISEHVFVTSSSFSEKTAKTLRNALLQLNTDKEGLAIMRRIHKNMTGMSPASDKDYDNLRTILRGLEKIGVKW